MTELETVLAGIDGWGAGHAAAAVLGTGGVMATRGDPGRSLPLGVGDEAGHGAGRAGRLRARSARPRRAGRPARRDRPAPAGARVGLAFEGQTDAGRAGDAPDLLEHRVRHARRRSSPSGRAGRSGRSSATGSSSRSGWRRPRSSSGRRRGSTGRWPTSSRSPANACGRRSSRARRSPPRRPSRSPGWSASCQGSAGSTRATGASVSSSTTARSRTGWPRARARRHSAISVAPGPSSGSIRSADLAAVRS